MSLPTFEDVVAARARIAGKAHVTPVLTCETLDALTGKQLFFKCENFQKVGAFKFRGAYNAVMQLSEEEAAKGVCTHSSGNHAQAIALAGKMRGIPTYIVIPHTAPKPKLDAVRASGAQIIYSEQTTKSREEVCEKVLAETGAAFVHPYDDARVIAGQGTLALELLEQVPDIDAIVVPVSGGGMAAGVCLGAHGVNPKVKIFAAEPSGANDCYQSIKKGEIVDVPVNNTICDGLRSAHVGKLNFAILKEHLSDVLLASDDEIKHAMFLLWERMKLVIEPSGAVGLACIMNKNNDLQGAKKIGVILSGGNVDLRKWQW